MARGISEAEYEAIKRKASKSVRFSDSTPQPRPVYRRSRSTASRRTAKKKQNTGFREILPVLGVAGIVAVIGAFLAWRASYAQQLRGLGNTCNAKIGGQIGNILGSISGIPGVGQLASLVGGLLGPSAHYTPSGMLYDTAAATLKSQAVELANLQNELYQRVGNPTRVPVPTWTMTSADDPKTGPYIAQILNAPQYAADTSPDPLIEDQADGVYDAVIQVQDSMIQAIEHALDGLDDGTYVIYQGTVVPAASSVVAQPGYSCSGGYSYCSTSGTYNANTGATASNSAAAPLFSNLTQNEWFAIGGLGVLGLIVLLKKRR
jgi:hypothetical protein